MTTRRARIARIAKKNNTLIQMGDNTHNQLQVITLASFKPMKRTVSAPVKLMPPEEVEDEEDIINACLDDVEEQDKCMARIAMLFVSTELD